MRRSSSRDRNDIASEGLSGDVGTKPCKRIALVAELIVGGQEIRTVLTKVVRSNTSMSKSYGDPPGVAGSGELGSGAVSEVLSVLRGVGKGTPSMTGIETPSTDVGDAAAGPSCKVTGTVRGTSPLSRGFTTRHCRKASVSSGSSARHRASERARRLRHAWPLCKRRLDLQYSAGC